MLSLGHLLAVNARRHPDKTALVFENLSFSYAELDTHVNRYANVLLARGVSKGDRIGILSTNTDRLVLAVYAGFKIGAIVVPMNPSSTPRELHYLLSDCGATALLFAPSQTQSVVGLVDLEPTALTTPPMSLGAVDGFDNLHDLAVGAPATAPGVVVSEDDDSLIMYTSGTTGDPKGALFDHHRMLWVGNNMAALGIEHSDIMLHVAPMYHCAELVLMLFTGISQGVTHVVLPSFDAGAVLDALERHRVTVFLGVPTMYQLLVRESDAQSRDVGAWRIGYFGAAPMSGPEVTRLLTVFPGVDFMQLYGQTEGGPGGMFSGFEDVQARPEATGRWPAPFVEVRIIDAAGVEVPNGIAGEIILRAETVMKCYWNRPQDTANAIRDGWLHTGDLAVRDQDGFVTIVDRMKDMIITGGRNVYSVEVENALAEHPGVLDVAVVSRPHEIYGESIVAVVDLVPDAVLTLEALRAFAGERVSGYKLPHEMVVRNIPRNPSGKILKHVLRAELFT